MTPSPAVEGTSCSFASTLDRARVQQRLEDTALVVARLSHNFGNVLTGILGFTELALAQIAPDSPAFPQIQEVYQSAQRGVEFLNQLNVFSRRTPKQSRPAFLVAVVAEEASRLRAAWAEAVKLQVSVPADLPPVTLDGTALRQVLTALLDNARQAIPTKGEVVLTARRLEAGVNDCLDLLGDPRPGPCVRLTVSDNGIGFSPEAQRRVFAEPFFSTKPRHRGMGLVSVYGLLRTCGGGFRLEHGAKAGTTVHVHLPLAVDEAQVTRDDPGSTTAADRARP